MASDATKQTISQSLNDLKAEVADRTRAIVTGVKIPELESTLLISPTDQVIVETNNGTKRTSLKTIGDVFAQAGVVAMQEVIDARNDGVTNYPQLKNRLDAMDGKTQANAQQIQNSKQEIAGLTNKYDTINKEVADARESNNGVVHNTLKERLDADMQEVINARTDNRTPIETHNSLKERLDSDYDYLNSEIEKTNTQLSWITKSKLYIDFFPRLVTETDDTDRIRRAFDYVRQNNIKELIFTDGEYIVTPKTDGSEVGIIIPNDLLMCGEGNVTIKTKMHEPYNGLFALDQGLGAKNVTIKNIKFSNLDDTHTATFKDGNNPCILLRIGDTLGDVVIEDCEFHSYAQNAVVSYPFNTSDGKVTFRRNNFYFSRHINEWYDATLLAIGHKEVDYHDNKFYSINNGTTSWKCSTPFEIHSYKCRAYNNDCEHFEGGCLIVASPPYLPFDSQITPDIKVYNNRFRYVRSGVQVWGEVTNHVTQATMKNIEVFENEIILEHDHNYKPLNPHNQLASYGLSLKVVGNCAGYENINFHHNTIDFKIVGSHNYTANDIYLQQRGALSCQTNILTRGITFKNNTVRNYPYESIVVGGDPSLPYNIDFLDNVFTDCSYVKNVPLIAFDTCDGVRIKNNKIICETKNYYDFIRFYNKLNKNITILENEILNITAQGYNLNIKYDDFTSMNNTLSTLKHDIRTIDFISKPKKPSIYFQDTYDNLSLNQGDVIFLTSGNIRGKVVTSQFANTKVYNNITCTKANGDDWLYVNDIGNLEVGDVVLVGTSATVITCLDWINNRVRVMFTVADFSGTLPVQAIYGTFIDLP